ncbi:hypothetical protein PENSPDRAFT_593697 [Peniophora sp. CONT]|nr:hypothetical protein PENSPDRAFT_593697 [Peniophora sp. CONT]
MSPEELRAAHNSVGAKLAEVANALLQKSKGTLVGNGSYAGFVSAALSHVPHARVPESSGSSTQYGFKIYHQVASTVHTRAAEILPGDIIVLVDARLKGHKGLHNYSLSVGEGTACVGVVVEFEGKKAKVRCAQANQHVGQATVEAVSYRLEDLKSGTLKIYRVLEA